MKLSADRRWWNSPDFANYSTAALLVLTVLELGYVGIKGLPCGIFSEREAPDACNLDSFSEPAIGAAVLRHEVERLFLVYSEESPLNADPGSNSGHVPINATSQAPAEAAPRGTAKALMEMHQQVRELSTGLDQQFLRLYFRERALDAFVDCYLRLLRTRPAVPDVLSWEWCALDCSRQCGRSEEVIDALHSSIRFHPDQKPTAGLGTVLKDWQAQNDPGLQVPEQAGL